MSASSHTPFFGGNASFGRVTSEKCPRGRILLISYHFPPGRAAGVLRWQKFARFAEERGWGLDVLALDPSNLGRCEDARLKDLPPSTRVFGIVEAPTFMDRFESAVHAVFEFSRDRFVARSQSREGASPAESISVANASPGQPSSFARTDVRFHPMQLRSWLRTYWGSGEYLRHGEWSGRALDVARSIYDSSEHRLIITCGPPHRVHDAGRKFHDETGVPWVMDLRDPWSRGERIPESLASPMTYWLARRSERACLTKASLVVMNTQPAAADMASQYPERADDIIAVPNAFDEDPIPTVERDPRFVVAYAGTIYLDRTPARLFRAAARVIRELELGPEDFAIELMGHLESLNGTSIEDLIDAAGLEGFVKLHPPSDYLVAQAFLAKASLLISLPQDSHLAIPSKVFDYMRFDARVVALAVRGSATEELLRGTAADVVEPDDEIALGDALRSAIVDWREGKTPTRLATSEARFSRRSRANELFEAIEARLEEGSDR